MRHMMAMVAGLAVAGQAAGQTARCIAQDQAAALVTFALPSLIEGLADRCRPALSPGAYLVANARTLADRYRPEADAAWPTARSAIAGLFTQYLGQPMPAEMNSDLIRQLAEPLLGTFLAKQVSTDDCSVADSAIANAAPLPGRAVGRLAVLAVTIADRKDRGLAGVLHICRPSPSR